MVSTPDEITDKSPMSFIMSVLANKSSAIKPLLSFSEVFDVKQKTAVQRLGAAKSKRKYIRTGCMLWSSITKRQGHKKINTQVKKSLYNWIIQHPQVVQSPMAKNCPKVSIDGHYEKQMVPKLLLQVYGKELHSIMVSQPE